MKTTKHVISGKFLLKEKVDRYFVPLSTVDTYDIDHTEESILFFFGT